MTAKDLLSYIGHVVDTALSPDRSTKDLHAGAVLVGFQCGFEPMVVAVVDAYDNMEVEEHEACEIAIDYLQEIKWFSKPIDEVECDYVVTLTQKDLDSWDAERREDYPSDGIDYEQLAQEDALWPWLADDCMADHNCEDW